MGLVKVKSKFDFEEMGALPVCLYSKMRGDFRGEKLPVAGYGKTRAERPYDESPEQQTLRQFSGRQAPDEPPVVSETH